MLPCYSKCMEIRAAIRGMDLQRGEWWICKRDVDRGWTLTADPYAPQWDWRVKVGSNKSRAVNRLRASEHSAYKLARDRKKLATARQIVDMLRSAARDRV
jgi:hypothetical protein